MADSATGMLLGRPAGTIRTYSATVDTSQSRSAHDGLVVPEERLDFRGIYDGRSNEDRIVDNSGEGGDHCHSQIRSDGSSLKSAYLKLIGVSVLCSIFMIGEIVGGVLASSLAIATDAAHLLSDLAGFLVSLFAMYVASRPATTRMSFGWHRAEVMGAMLSVLIIWVVTIVLVYLAVQRVLNQDYVIDAQLMLIMSLISIAFNVIMMLVLCIDPRAHGHSHGGGGHSNRKTTTASVASNHPPKTDHGHTHSGARNKPNDCVISENRAELAKVGSGNKVMSTYNEANINVRAAFIHAVGDLLQSVGVFVAAMIIYFVPNAKIADPICTFVFSALVTATTFNILRESLSVLMEAVPKDMSFSEIRTALASIEGVIDIHDLRLWSLTTNKPALSVHLAIDITANADHVLAKARTLVHHNFTIYEYTFQVERYVAQMSECEKCQDPKE